MVLDTITILHIVSIVFSIIELGLTSYVASAYYGPFGGRSPDRVNFMIFNSIWSLLVLAYLGLTPIYAAGLFHKMVALGLLFITMIFWFAGAIALAVFVGSPYWCGLNTYCGSSQAAVAFGFFLWLLFTALFVFEAVEFFRSRRSATSDPHQPHAKTQPYAGA